MTRELADLSPDDVDTKERNPNGVEMKSRVSKQPQARSHQIIPGGAHTYAKGDDQFPEEAPALIARGKGCHVWDADGNEFIEYGMGLRAVTLGHAFEPVVEAAYEVWQHAARVRQDEQ